MYEEFNFIPEEKTLESNESSSQNVGDNSAESVLKGVAYTIFSVGIVASIVGGFAFDEGFAGFIIAVLGAIVSVVLWASLMVVVNISTNIREIKHILKDKK